MAGPSSIEEAIKRLGAVIELSVSSVRKRRIFDRRTAVEALM
jgi:hypothetical protein